MRYHLIFTFILTTLHFNVFQKEKDFSGSRCPANNKSCLQNAGSILIDDAYKKASEKFYLFRYSHGIKHFKNTNEYVQTINKLIKLEKEISREFDNLNADRKAYVKLFLNFHNEPPSPEAIYFMANHRWWTKALLQVHIYADLVFAQSFTELFKLISGPYGLLNFAKDQPPFFKGLVRWTYIRTAGIISMFNPLAIPTRAVNFPDNLITILNKQYRNPNYPPTARELEILEKWQLVDAFFQRRNFMQSRPLFSVFRSRLTTIKEAFVGISALTVLNQLREQNDQPVLSILEFMQTVPPRDTIQIIIEQVPFPHLSLKIGGQVYTFGQTTLNTLPVQDYYLANMQKRNSPEFYRQLIEKRGYQFNETIEKFLNNISMSQPHSANVYEITLSNEEVDRLRSYLENQSLRDYINWTGINDCATMISRALNDHTSLKISYLVDASPNQIGLQLATLKSLGDRRISSIYTIASEEEYRKNYHLYRNAAISFAESSLFTNFFIYLRTARLYVDGYYGEDVLQTRSEEAQGLIKEWQVGAVKDLYAGAYVQFDYILAKNKTRNGATKESIQISIDSMKDRIKDLENISPQDNFYERMTRLAKIEEANRLIDLLQAELED